MSVSQAAEVTRGRPPASGAMRVARNALAQAGSQILLTPVSLVFVALVARILGPEGYGVFQLAQSFPALVGAAIPLGMNVFFSRDLAQRPHEAPRYAELGYGLILVTGIAGYFALQFAAAAMGFHEEVRTAIVLSGLIAVCGAVATFTGAFFRAFERLQLDALLASGERLAGVALAIVAVLVWQSPLALVAALLVASVGRLVISQIVMRRAIGPFGLRFEGGSSLELVRTGLPFLLAGYCTIFNDTIGLTVLGSIGTPTEVGTYAAAWRLVVFGTIVALAFSNATLPVLARAAAGDRRRLQIIVDSILPGLALVTGIGASLMAILAGPLVGLIYGERFADVPVLLANLLLVLPALCLMYFTGNALMSVGEQPFITRLQVTVAVVGLALNVILARAFGPLGTAAALLIVDHLICLGYLWRLRSVAGTEHLRPVFAAWCVGVVPATLAAHLPLPVPAQFGLAVLTLAVAGLVARRHIVDAARAALARLNA